MSELRARLDLRGDLKAARTAYRESLPLARTFPDQPRYQQDLVWIEARVADNSVC
jgi:hypothetical protein